MHVALSVTMASSSYAGRAKLAALFVNRERAFVEARSVVAP